MDFAAFTLNETFDNGHFLSIQVFALYLQGQSGRGKPCFCVAYLQEVFITFISGQTAHRHLKL